MAEMSGIEVASETAARPGGLPAGLGGYSLALILLYGIDMSKASSFLKKILTLYLTHLGQKASYYICAGTYRQSIGAGSSSS